MSVELAGTATAYPVELGGEAADNVFTPITDLSVSAHEDAQVVLSPAYDRTADGTFVTNSPNNPATIRLRAATLALAVYRNARMSARNANGEEWRPRLGYVAMRRFTSFAAKGDPTIARPSMHDADVGSCGFSGLDGTTALYEWTPCTPGDGENCTTKMESMVLPEHAGSEHGMYWELAGFVTNREAVFDLVSISRFRLREKQDGDSNSPGGYLEPESGSTNFNLRQARNGVLGQPASDIPYDVRGSTRQWPTLLMDEYASTRGFDRDVNSAAHGGRFQGIMGPNTRASLSAQFWTNLYLDVIDTLDKPFHQSTPWTSGAHWSGGAWRPHVWLLGSAKNDWLRRAFEIAGAFGAAGEEYFGGATYQGGIKATLDALLALCPDTAVLAHTSAEIDGGGVDTYARFKAACIAGGADGRAFQDGSTPGAEGATGLYLSLQRDGAAAGLPTNMSTAPLHWTATQHAALVSAVKALVFSWLDAALGIKFVDSATAGGGTGTFAAPFNTIAAAGSSWTMLALKGTFAEKLTLGASGTAGKPKVVYSYSGTAVISGGAGARDCIDTGGHSNVWIHGVDLSGGIVGLKIASGTGVRASHVLAHGCTSHGISIAGGTVTLETCDGYSNAGQGLDVSGAASVTGRRNTWRQNTGSGVRVSGTAVVLEDGVHVHSNTDYGYRASAGTATLRNSKVAVGTAPAAFNSATMADGGTLLLENCLLHNGSADPAVITYLVRATGSGRVGWENCIFQKATNDLATFVWVDAVGASGNITKAKNTAHLNSGQPLKYAVGPTLIGAATYDYAGWRALTDRSGVQLDVGSAHGATGLSVTPSSDVLTDRPTAATASIARNLGTNLSASFTRDFLRRTRPASGAWDAGPWIF